MKEESSIRRWEKKSHRQQVDNWQFDINLMIRLDERQDDVPSSDASTITQAERLPQFL